MTLEWGLIQRPPCRRVESRRLGPFQTVAMVAQGRRTDALIARHDEADGPWLLRVLHPDQDKRAFARELDHASAFDGAARVEGAAEYEGLVVAHVRPVVGETLATILARLFESGASMPAELAINLISGIASRFPGPPKPHGDLVPHHVLVGYDGYVHVIDPASPDALAERARAPGRVGYQSPEHVSGQPVGPASDVFSLGALLFELTTGHRLFEGEDAARAGREILSGEYKRPRSVVEAYPIELQVVLRRMLRPAAQDRFSDPSAAADALRRTSDRARSAGPALGQWLAQQFPDRREAWQLSLRAAGFDLPSAPAPAPRSATVPKVTPRVSTAPAAVAPSPPKAAAPVARIAPVPARPKPPAPTGPSLTLEQLEQADAEGRSLFDSPPMDFGGRGTGEITAPSQVGPRADRTPPASPPMPAAAPRSDTLIDPGPRLESEQPTAIVSAELPKRPSARPAPIVPPRAPASEAPPRPVPKISRPPERAKPKSKMDLTSDLLEDFGAAPATDRQPIPASLPPEEIDSIDLEIKMDFANEPEAEVSIPSPRRLQRAPSLDPEAATAQLDMSRLRPVDDRAATALDPLPGAPARPSPPRKEATMVVRDRGPKSRPAPSANASPPPAPKPSDSPPAPSPPAKTPSSPAAASRPTTDDLEPLEALADFARKSTAPPGSTPARRTSSVVPLPRRPAVERGASSTADRSSNPPRRKPPRDPTSEYEQLVIPVVEEETPERRRRALVFVVGFLIAVGVASGIGVTRFFPELVPPSLRRHLGPLAAPRPTPELASVPDGSIPATTITSSAAELTEESEELPPLVPLIPAKRPEAIDPGAEEVQTKLVIFPARARIVVDGVRVMNGATIALGPTPKKIELKARGCTPYSGTVDASVGESFEMVLPCKDITRP